MFKIEGLPSKRPGPGIRSLITLLESD